MKQKNIEKLFFCLEHDDPVGSKKESFVDGFGLGVFWLERKLINWLQKNDFPNDIKSTDITEKMAKILKNKKWRKY